MYEQISNFNLFSSIMIGMTAGMYVDNRWEFPRNIWGFLICFALNIYSTKISLGAFSIISETSQVQTSIIIHALLFSFLFVLNVMYLFRKLNEKLNYSEKVNFP